MRWELAVALLLAGALVACQNEATGPTRSDYQAARAAALEKARKQGGGPGGTRTASRQAPAGEAQEEAAAEEGVRVSEYRYDPTGKRDPFRSFVLENARVQAKDEAGPLERFDVSQLSVVATVWETDEPRALIADPSGRSYIVQPGARIGKNDGKVVEIADGRVVVKETYVDWLGERTTKNVEMRLHREGKGG